MSKNYSKKKSTFESRSETIARRAQRATKYANAAMTTKSGRSRRTAEKAAW